MENTKNMVAKYKKLVERFGTICASASRYFIDHPEYGLGVFKSENDRMDVFAFQWLGHDCRVYFRGKKDSIYGGRAIFEKIGQDDPQELITVIFSSDGDAYIESDDQSTSKPINELMPVIGKNLAKAILKNMW